MLAAHGPEVRTFTHLQLRDVEASTSGKFIAGRAVPYGVETNVGWYMEQHDAGSFARSIEEAAKGLPLLLFHDSKSFPVGVTDSWDDNRAGLDAVWRMDGSQEADRAHQLAKDGMLTGLSIGFVPIRSAWDMAEEWNPDLGPEFMDHVTRQESRLLEVSMVSTPAFAGAQVTMVRSRDARRREEARADGSFPRLEAWKQWLDLTRKETVA